MQQDFHHAVVYVLSRLSGFSVEDAQTVAYASQYVDDATNNGSICFTNGAMYSRISSAHKTLDYRNFLSLANHQVWVPFHFLPGNGGAPAGENPNGNFIKKLICRPDSPPARDLLDSCLMDVSKPYALHRLGVTLHTYADTWAHQGFAGVNHKINDVTDVEESKESEMSFVQRSEAFFEKTLERTESELIEKALPLGHGAALSNPDKPYLIWSYINGLGDRIKRDNAEIFLDAAISVFDFLCEFRGEKRSLPDRDLKVIKQNFVQFDVSSVADRHKMWMDAIADGAFSFGKEKIGYVDKGEASWKYTALGTEATQDCEKDRFKFTDKFFNSNWQLFHHALQMHRLTVLRDILPRYSICAA